MAPTRLLDLPKELRLQIWEQVFDNHQQGTAIIVGQPSKWTWLGLPANYHPDVLRVCRMIRDEALAMLYRDRPVVLLLRYREGREQVQRWIDDLMHCPDIQKNIKTISIQCFETAHRSTSVLVDCKNWRLMNRTEWLHPITEEPFSLLCNIEEVLQAAYETAPPVASTLPDTLRLLILAMTRPLCGSRLLLHETMASVRLHGYTDFQLRFEVLQRLYYNYTCGLH